MRISTFMRLRFGAIRVGRIELRWTLTRHNRPVPKLDLDISSLRPGSIKLHFGPGAEWKTSDHSWITVDADPTRGDIVLDFAKFESLPLAAKSVACVYASHTFEHINVFRLPLVLAECHRVLIDGGWVRIVVPDARKSMEEYLTGNADWPLFVRRRERAKRLYGEHYTLFECMKEDFLSRSDQGPLLGPERLAHQNAWDFDSLARSLERAGFAKDRIYRRHFRVVGSPEFDFEGTYDSEANEEDRSLYVEAQK